MLIPGMQSGMKAKYPAQNNHGPLARENGRVLMGQRQVGIMKTIMHFCKFSLTEHGLFILVPLISL